MMPRRNAAVRILSFAELNNIAVVVVATRAPLSSLYFGDSDRE